MLGSDLDLHEGDQECCRSDERADDERGGPSGLVALDDREDEGGDAECGGDGAGNVESDLAGVAYVVPKGVAGAGEGKAQVVLKGRPPVVKSLIESDK